MQGLEEYRKAQTVLLYASSQSTFGPDHDCLADGKVTVLPKVDRGDVRLFVTGPWKTSRRGIWASPEPWSSVQAEKAIEDMDFIVVPGAAFDEACKRMGYGKGYQGQAPLRKKGLRRHSAYSPGAAGHNA
ncbi:MAG: hypothetical protein MZV70_35890 [Desulfobacterales bacterium]|nr:hypothetical protein [Desulfobacterales bacterium]